MQVQFEAVSIWAPYFVGLNSTDEKILAHEDTAWICTSCSLLKWITNKTVNSLKRLTKVRVLFFLVSYLWKVTWPLKYTVH